MSINEHAAPKIAAIEEQPDYDERPARGSITTAIGAAIIPLFLGIFGSVVAFGLGLGSPSSPGPGLWPLVISAFLIVAAVAGLLHVKHDDDIEAWGQGLFTLGSGVISLFAYAALFPLIGFEIPTVLLLFFWIKVLGREGWRTAVSVSVITTVTVYALFILALGVNLPHLF